MKIALALDRLDPPRGGLESWARDLACWLVGRGHDVHVAAFDFAPGLDTAGISLHPVARARTRLESSGAITERVRALAADVVHDLGIGWCFDVLHPQFGCRSVSRERHEASIPWRDRWRDVWSFRQRRRWRELSEIEQRQLRNPSGHLIASSRMVAGHFERRHGLPADRIHVIYNGVDTGRFSPEACAPLRRAARARLSASGATPVLLMVTSNFYLKGLPTALRALARLVANGSGARLVVAGRGDTTPFAATIERLGLKDHVTFLGHVDDMLPYYAAADVAVLPTYHDTCSLTVLEAWACGIPAVTTTWNGASELMQPGREGYVLQRAEDDERLAADLSRVLDGERRAAMGRAARELALRCTLETNFSRIENLYEVRLQRRKARAGA
jgi:UDP-glucose:(heptosyl)LPS alpha-1,3-glucosyltransferase